MGHKSGSVIAGCFALTAFAVAIVAGLMVGNATLSTLARALTAMVLCYPVGLIVGIICDRVVDDHLRTYRASHPLHESPGVAAAPVAGAAVEVRAAASPRQEPQDILEV